MKKHLLSLALIASMALQATAQDQKGFVGISLGPSIPLGNFASKNVNSQEAGFAKPGATFDITAGYKLGGSHFGIIATLRGQSYAYDTQPLVNDLSFQAPQFNWNVENSTWRTGSFLIGGFGSIPISERVFLDARAMVGFANSTSPQLNITGTDLTDTFWVKRDSRSASSLAYLFGAGFKFDVAPKLYLLTNIDYMATSPEFSNVDLTTSIGDRQSITFKQNMGVFNLSIGVALKL